MTELPLDMLDDPTWVRSNHTVKGRDGCRVPLPWSIDGVSAGFGPGPSWLPQPDGWSALSVEAQTGVEESMLELYRTGLALRKEVFANDLELEWLPSPADAIEFRRGSGVRCVVNLGFEPLEVDGVVLLASEPVANGSLPANATAWLR